MDLVAAATTGSHAATVNAAQVLMLKKAMDTESSAALALLNSLPQREGLGQIVDVQA